MKKSLVVFYSRTGNTAKVATAICEALDGEKSLRRLRPQLSVEGYGLVFVGFPVHMHSLPVPVENYLKAVPAGTKIALFCTHGSYRGHRLSREAVEQAMVAASKAKILGAFDCRGQISLEALEVLNKSPEHQEWSDMAASAANHPDASDLAEAADFARQMQTAALHHGY